MLKRIESPQLASELAQLSTRPECAALMHHLRESLIATDVKGRALEGVALSRNQGAAMTLAALIDLIETAPETFRKLRS
mgnify:CR=1 FL=1